MYPKEFVHSIAYSKLPYIAGLSLSHIFKKVKFAMRVRVDMGIVVGSVLVNDFFTPQAPPPINIVHDQISIS